MELLALKPNWDSYGAVEIDPLCLYKAQLIEHELRPVFAFPFTFVPCSDGSVQLEQHAEGFDIEIHIARSHAAPVVSRAEI